jgi:hypothetical protein
MKKNTERWIKQRLEDTRQSFLSAIENCGSDSKKKYALQDQLYGFDVAVNIFDTLIKIER